MLDIRQLKKDYQLKFFHVKGENKRIYIKEITYYLGSKTYRIIYEENLGEINYLNELKEIEVIEFIDNLIINPIKQINMEVKETKIDLPKANNLNELNQKLYTILDELYNDKISIEKAKAISSFTQTILNVEKFQFSINIK